MHTKIFRNRIIIINLKNECGRIVWSFGLEYNFIKKNTIRQYCFQVLLWQKQNVNKYRNAYPEVNIFQNAIIKRAVLLPRILPTFIYNRSRIFSVNSFDELLPLEA
jgi:hypothetical protein